MRGGRLHRAAAASASAAARPPAGTGRPGQPAAREAA